MNHYRNLKKSRKSILLKWVKLRNKSERLARFWAKRTTHPTILPLDCDLYSFLRKDIYLYSRKLWRNHSRQMSLNLRRTSYEGPLISSPLNLIEQHKSLCTNGVVWPCMIDNGPVIIDSFYHWTMSRTFHRFLIFRTFRVKDGPIDLFIWSQ